MSSIENITRRSVMKLLAMVSPAMCPSSSASGGAIGDHAGSGVAADRQKRRPRLFYDTAALKHIRQMLASDPATDAFLKHRGEELLKADFIPESVAEIGGGQQADGIGVGKRRSCQ
jgi:hypothetical protein